VQKNQHCSNYLDWALPGISKYLQGINYRFPTTYTFAALAAFAVSC
jgi:hypothetical protein